MSSSHLFLVQNVSYCTLLYKLYKLYPMSKLRKMTSLTVKAYFQNLHSQFLNAIPTGLAKQTK